MGLSECGPECRPWAESHIPIMRLPRTWLDDSRGIYTNQLTEGLRVPDSVELRTRTWRLAIFALAVGMAGAVLSDLISKLPALPLTLPSQVPVANCPSTSRIPDRS